MRADLGLHYPRFSYPHFRFPRLSSQLLKSRKRLYTLVAASIMLSTAAHGADHVTLKNGFDMVCDHREIVGDTTRLYVGAGAGNTSNFVAVRTADIASVDSALPLAPPAAPDTNKTLQEHTRLSATELHELLSAAGAERNLDVDLLACVVHAESNGQVRAVSHSGAQGLMQLMPGTAAQLGVHDSFEPGQNVSGGTAYLNTLLVRYHDNLALALAAYNAGPEAVDRYHGVPPYRETRAYVARIINEFNKRKTDEASAARHLKKTENASSLLRDAGVTTLKD